MRMLTTRLSLFALLLALSGCALKPAVSPEADAKLRTYASAELAQAQRLLQSRDPQQHAALQHLSNAEAALELPRDARIAAEVQVWMGIAHMQAGRSERGREHFRIARGLFESIGAEAEAEGVDHLLRR